MWAVILPSVLPTNMYDTCSSPIQPMSHSGVGKLVKADGIATKVRQQDTPEPTTHILIIIFSSV